MTRDRSLFYNLAVVGRGNEFWSLLNVVFLEKVRRVQHDVQRADVKVESV